MIHWWRSGANDVSYRDARLEKPERAEYEMFQDIRYGARMLLSRPGLNAAVSLVLALNVWTGTNAKLSTGERSGNSPIPATIRALAGIPREPDVSGSEIVFLYAGGLWLVPRDGGTARPVGETPPVRSAPKFSPDGRTLAFTGENDAIYTVPVSGGVSARLTSHVGATDLCDWTPDGRLLFMSESFLFLHNTDGQARMRQLFIVPTTGGLPQKLPAPYGAHGAISPDGEWLAYTSLAQARNEMWKRNRGGSAPDIWLFNLRTQQSKRMTDWVGTDTAPMWQGQTIYYLSDAGADERPNIWSYDTKSGQRRQVTHFTEYDVKWPSVGPGADGQGEIVFVNGANLYLIDLRTMRVRMVEVTIPEERLDAHPRTVDASPLVTNWNPSPDGKQIVVEARGDIWVIPVGNGPTEKGAPRNLTRSSGIAERDPSWSPDGRWLAYFSDASGEYELTITPSDGSGTPHQLTRLGTGFRYRPTWSPDSRRVAFSDSTGGVYVHTLESAETKKIHQDPVVREPRMNWSHDSSWLAFVKNDGKGQAIWLYDIATGEARRATAGANENWPTFDRRGDYLFFTSSRNFDSIIFDSVEYANFVYPTTDLLMAAPLRRELGPPWRPNPSRIKKDSGQGSAPEEPGKSVRIDFDDIERRAVALGSEPGSYRGLAVTQEGGLLYGFTTTGAAQSLRILDVSQVHENGKSKSKSVLTGTGNGRLSADGKKILVRGSTLAMVDAAPDQKLDVAIRLSGMNVEIDSGAEWRQIFTEAWRLYRDFFYDPAMLGVDWPAMRRKYAKLLDACARSEDVYYVIGEMLGELGSSHVYLNAPAAPRPPSEDIGMLGADFSLERGAYRITKIYDDESPEWFVRNPLRQPGVNVKEGEYLLAVNGVPLDARQPPWAAFKGLSWKDVTLTISDKPTLDESAREVVVQPGQWEPNYRRRAWAENTRAYVERQTGGRVGYIQISTTTDYGFQQFTRQFNRQLNKDALIIDLRWNGGGQIPFHLVDILSHRASFYGVDRRRSVSSAAPSYLNEGPRCLLINGLTQSGGIHLPLVFKKWGLGKLIGTRTMGGGAGAGGIYIPFIDGGSAPPPNIGFFDADGKWQGSRGVEPDIEVVDDPALMANGGDPQLDVAIREMMDELLRRPPAPRPLPPFENQSGKKE